MRGPAVPPPLPQAARLHKDVSTCVDVEAQNGLVNVVESVASKPGSWSLFPGVHGVAAGTIEPDESTFGDETWFTPELAALYSASGFATSRKSNAVELPVALVKEFWNK